MYSVVVVRQNLVEKILHRVKLDERSNLLATNLEAGTQLSENFRCNGCIDGEYWFDDPERAKSFATIAMDFVKKLIENRMEVIERLNQQEEFSAPLMPLEKGLKN